MFGFFFFCGQKARRSVGKSVIATRAALDQHLLVLLHLLVFILISEVLFENHVYEKVSSIKIIIIIRNPPLK